MTYVLEPYQERSVQLMMKHPFHYLAYDMGLGKTLIVLEYLRRTNQKALIVAPLLVAQRTWKQEIEKWGLWRGENACVVLHGKDKDALMKSDARIKVINYEGLKWAYNHIAQKGSNDLSSRLLVLDEASMFKSSPGGLTVRFKVLKAMQHFFRQGIFCLSGSPMPGGYMNLWSQYWMLDRGAALGTSFSAFRKKYFFESGAPRWEVALKAGAAEAIQELIAPMTSVLKAEDHIRMPEVVKRNVEVTLPPKAREMYKRVQNTHVWEPTQNTLDAGPMVNKLRQITQGAFYKEDGVSYEALHEEKLEALQMLLESTEGDPVVCAINFKFELHMIRKHLKYDVPCIAGGTAQAEKNRIISQFGAGQIPLLLCQPASLSHGLNDLKEHSRTIIWYSLPWSLEHYQQLLGRLARRGQKRTVVEYHIVATKSIDERISEVLYQKGATQEDFKQAVLRGAREKYEQ